MILPRTLACASAALGLTLLSATGARADSKQTKAQCVAANESGQDLRRTGKLREAKAALASCVVGSCPSAVREDCAERLADVERALPTVVVAASDAAGKDLVEVHVTVDGEPLTDVLDGKAAPLDPGEHRFRFEANGLPTKDETIVLAEGEKTRRVHVVLGEPPAALAAPPPLTPSPPATPSGGTQRWVGIGLLAGGAVSAGVGVVFGLVAKNTQDGALARCKNGDPNDCPPQALDDSSTAHAQATASTIAFAAAGALVVGGLVVYLSAPGDRDRATVGLSIGDRSVALRGTW